MKRRGFFGTVVGLCLGALGVKAKPPAAGNCVVAKWRKQTVGVGFDLSAGTGEFITTPAEMERIERAMWGPRPKQPYGIKYWLK